MTVNDIKQGIAEALKGEYYDFDIYTKRVEQGFSDRSFFIERIGSQKTQLICGEDAEAYEYTHNFALTCFCDENKTRLYEIADSLYYVLSVIMADGERLAGSGMSHSYSDGAVVFIVDYKTKVTVHGEDIPEMEVLSINGEENAD